MSLLIQIDFHDSNVKLVIGMWSFVLWTQIFRLRHQGTDTVLKNNESFNTITKGLVFFLNIPYIYSGLKYKFNKKLNEVRQVIYMLYLCPHNKTTIYIHDKPVSNHIPGLREPQNGTVRWQLKLGFLLQSQFFLYWACTCYLRRYGWGKFKTIQLF